MRSTAPVEAADSLSARPAVTRLWLMKTIGSGIVRPPLRLPSARYWTRLVSRGQLAGAMSDPSVHPGEDDLTRYPSEVARDRLMSDRRSRRMRRLWRTVPGAPRCKICQAPFGGP